MATYAIGDLQGCLEEFQQLLALLEFDPAKDHLWLTGDLVGRGPKPLETLRQVREMGDAVTLVLGNHDLHLLAQGEGIQKTRTMDPTFQEVLQAPDRHALFDWLRHQPLMHIDRRLGYGMIHAGLPPQWDLDQAQDCAAEVENALRSKNHRDFLSSMYGDKPDHWQPELKGKARLRFITNCLTRLRFCYPDGRLALNEKGSPLAEHSLIIPWFAMPARESRDFNWVFGHWSTLEQIKWPNYNVQGIDTGCVWGGALTALCLETGLITQLPSPGYKTPG